MFQFQTELSTLTFITLTLWITGPPRWAMARWMMLYCAAFGILTTWAAFNTRISARLVNAGL